MKESYFVLTDSGGIQEEAPSLGKPVLVIREVTERPEGVASGNAVLVGVRADSISYNINHLLDNAQDYNKMSKANNPYGDGRSAVRIVNLLARYFA
jgi:UDP-N-acetylglucosamine 2-epimerase (non-hydrolysing)